MRRDNGVLPALGVAAAMAALGAWGSRGSSNDDWGLVPAGQRRPARGGRRGGMVPRHAPSDRDLLMQAMTGGDPLGGMAPAQAAQDDPRRIIARIDQIVMPAFFAPMMGAMPQQGEHLQIPPMMRDQALANEARMWKTVRDLSGGLPSVKAWTTMVTDNIDQTLRRTAEMLPPAPTGCTCSTSTPSSGSSTRPRIWWPRWPAAPTTTTSASTGLPCPTPCAPTRRPCRTCSAAPPRVASAAPAVGGASRAPVAGGSAVGTVTAAATADPTAAEGPQPP